MSQFDEILNDIPVFDSEMITLDDIMKIHPSLDLQNPLLYHLYLTYNNNKIKDIEREKIRTIIERLKYNQQAINKYNMEYMNRHIQ